MTRKELAQQALDILKDENEQLYNTLSWYIDCLEKENTKLKKAIEILKGTKNIEVYFFDNGKRHYRIKFDRTREQEISQEKFDLLKEVLEQ